MLITYTTVLQEFDMPALKLKENENIEKLPNVR